MGGGTVKCGFVVNDGYQMLAMIKEEGGGGGGVMPVSSVTLASFPTGTAS